MRPEPTTWAAARDETALQRDLDACRALLAGHLDAARARFGAHALGVVVTPRMAYGRPTRAELNVAAVMLWAREVDRAGLLRFVERLAEGVTSGTFMLPISAAGTTLARYHRERDVRFDAEEREGLYSVLFGGPGSTNPNTGFEDDFTSMIDTLVELGRSPPDRDTTRFEVRIQLIGRTIAGPLAERSAGIMPYAARGIVAHIRQALDILGDDELRRALGGRSLWSTVRMHALELLGHDVQPDIHLARAQAGFQLLSWLAESAPELNGSGFRIDRGAPVIRAAETWQATEFGP